MIPGITEKAFEFHAILVFLVDQTDVDIFSLNSAIDGISVVSKLDDALYPRANALLGLMF